MLLSAIFFPNYSLINMAISDLGAPHYNPSGWYFWSIGMTFIGITVIPLIPYVYRRLIVINKYITRIGTLFVILAVIGIIGLGIFPQFESFLTLHQINAGFVFSGLYIALFFLEIPVIRDLRIKKINSAIFLFIGWSGLISSLFVQIFSLIVNGSQWFFNDSFWEWVLMLCIFSAYIILLYILPEEIYKSKI